MKIPKRLKKVMEEGHKSSNMNQELAHDEPNSSPSDEPVFHPIRGIEEQEETKYTSNKPCDSLTSMEGEEETTEKEVKDTSKKDILRHMDEVKAPLFFPFCLVAD